MVIAERAEGSALAESEHTTSASILLCAWRSLTVETAECMRVMEDRGWQSRTVRGDALIQRARSRAVSHWYRTSTDDVFLMIDDDVVFDASHAEKVVALAREKRCIAVGAYPVKDGGHLACRGVPGQELVFGDDSPAVKILWPATGFMAVHRDVIDAMVAAGDIPLCNRKSDQPWWPLFDTFWIEGDDDCEYLSEDYAFGERARRLGFETWLDQSVILYHLGQYPYNVFNMPTARQLKREALPIETSRGRKLRFPPDDLYISEFVRRTGCWEEDVAQAIERHLRPDDTFLDLGAGVGYFSLIAAPLCRRVVAAEADPAVASLLKENANLNGISNIDIHAVAVANKSGPAHLTPDSLVNPGRAYLGETGQEVGAQRLVDLLGHCQPQFIKADIEGLEYAVFADSPAIMRAARVVVFEASPAQCARYGITTRMLLDLMDEVYDFDVTFADGSPLDERFWNMAPQAYTNLLAIKRGAQ